MWDEVDAGQRTGECVELQPKDDIHPEKGAAIAGPLLKVIGAKEDPEYQSGDTP